MNDTVIKIDNVYKQYRLGAIGGGTLKGDLQSWWARVRHKEDPNLRIGQRQYEKNEKFMALDGISLEVKKGETLGLIGRNGAGKSTALKLLSRVTAPTEGNIYIKGKISSMLEVGTGFHPELTGRENIYLNGAILGMKRDEVSKKIEDIIDFSECRQFIDTPVKRYSSGMFVKLAFSVAAHLDSDILIMDEVLAVGDMKFQKKCIDKMLSIANSGRTIIYVSHNMETVRRLCSRSVVMKDGKIIYDGETDKAITIYMENSRMQKKTFIDYSDYPRLNFLTDKAKLISFQLINKDNCLFKDNEKIHFKLKWKTTDNIENLSMRLMIHNEDRKPIATSICPDFMSCKKDTIYEKEFCTDVSQLSGGVYEILLVLFERESLGQVIDADAVWPAFVFEREKTSSIAWKKQSYSEIELNETFLVL